MTVFCYLDDFIFMTTSSGELRNIVWYALQFFYSLGPTINVQKSVLIPTQEVEFLGITFNSITFTATLLSRRKYDI